MEDEYVMVNGRKTVNYLILTIDSQKDVSRQ